MSSLDQLPQMLSRIDPDTGQVEGARAVSRRLSDLRGVFADSVAFEALLSAGDPVVYQVASVEPAHGEGQLHYGVGVLHPGRVGDEYFMTKGHLHAWRPAAEFYIGLRGSGVMLLESEGTIEGLAVPFGENQVVYVPGHVAHRTVNTGSVPLIYIGVYPAMAGHDYGAIADRNFSQVVVARDGGYRVTGRADHVRELRDRANPRSAENY